MHIRKGGAGDGRINPARMVAFVIDFETRSRLALDECNVYKYARHSSTEVLCMSYADTRDGKVRLWKPGEAFPFGDAWPDIKIIAFNSEFEHTVWQSLCVPRYGWPELLADRVDCLMARTSHAGLPRGLGEVCTSLGMWKDGKDKGGRENLLKITKPVKVKGNPVKLVGCEYFGGEFDVDPVKHERNEEYCRKDTSAEMFVHGCVAELPPNLKALWQAHRRINERGVPVDVDLCRNATALVGREYDRLAKRLAEITGREDVTPDCNVWLKDWLRTHTYPYHSLNKQCVEMALGLLPGCPPLDLSDDCKEVLNIRRLCRDSAVSKYQGMLNHAEADGRCRAAHVFYKAGPGRFAGAGVNFLNLRRLVESEVDDNVDLAYRISEADDDDLDDIYEELRTSEKGVIPTLGGMVRMGVCAKSGNKLVVCDYSSIEYRMLHWLAGDKDTLKVIADFDNGIGEDPYKLAAATIYNKPVKEVTKAERGIGKVMILGCGYMSGATTFQGFCASYGIEMSLEKSQELVQTYRRMYPRVRNFWYDVGRCAVRAVTTGRKINLRHVDFFLRGNTLNIRLPSGRCLKYYDPSVVDGDYGPEIESLCVDPDSKRKTMRVDASGNKYYRVGLPLLVENIDQGVSFDLLADNLVRGDMAKLPVVLHIYDEDVMEVRENDQELASILRHVMRDVPAWAKGLPVDAKLGEHRRYTK